MPPSENPPRLNTSELAPAGKGPFTSRIIKANALIPDTKALLHLWDETVPVEENLARVRAGNLLGSPSQSRLADILPIFRRRYLRDPALAGALSVLVRGRLPSDELDQILYYYALQADELLAAFVTEVLYPRYCAGRLDLSVAEVIETLTAWMDAGLTTGYWSDVTRKRVAQHLLATLRDFGVLSGANVKRLTPPPVAVRAFAFIAFDRFRLQASGKLLINDSVWTAFFLDQLAVERQFLSAHKAGLLYFAAAGSVVRIEFPASSLDEYARLLTAHASNEFARSAA